MRFLLINQFFAPDPAPTGQLLAHVAAGLARQGHEVTVVCGETPYAAAAGQSANIPGVTVHRVRGRAFGRGHAARLSGYARFYAGAMRQALFGPRPDIVLTLTTPPLLSLAGTLARRIHGSRHVNWEMDVYPDVAVALGVFAQGSLIERAVGLLADFARRRADANIVLGPCMRDRLAARGIPEPKMAVAENWMDDALVASRPFPESPRLEVLYSGNFGLPHDTDTIAEAMLRLAADSRFRFVFAGGGAGRGVLETRCRERRLSNAVFLPYQPESGLAEHFGNCHVGLVTQKPETCGAVVPSKTYAFMAAGRPLIFVGPREATPARIIEHHHCGWHVEPGDVDSLTALLMLLQARPEIARAAGARARDAFLSFYHREAGVSRILDILTSCNGASESHAEPERRNALTL
jgi:colanic acid biosynthesis glycosyl transferase WcaI